MGIRKIETILPFTDVTYTDRSGCCKATVRRNLNNSKGVSYVVFETSNGNVDTMTAEDFKDLYFESTKHDLEPGDIFQILHEGPAGNSGANVYFLFLSERKVVRIGSNWKYNGKVSSATLEYYVDDIADGDYEKISKVTDTRRYGYTINK